MESAEKKLIPCVENWATNFGLMNGISPISVAICDTPTGGHDMIFLDYRECDSDGEPQVVHISQEDDFIITYLAENFEEFIRGLVHEDEFEDEMYV